MHIGYIGLGKMGLAQVKRLVEKGYGVVAYNRSEEPRAEAKKAGAEVTKTVTDVAHMLKTPRVVWLMVPSAAVDDVLRDLVPHLSKGDTVIDGGNSFYKHSIRREKELAKKGINFLDSGTSGGPSGRSGCVDDRRGRKSLQSTSSSSETFREETRFNSSDEVEPSSWELVYGQSGSGTFREDGTQRY